jgi:cell division protein FtsI (penicillin-binding protein 3)
MQEREERKRVWFVAALLFIALCCLGGRLAYLHLANHSKLNNFEYSRQLLGMRGRIFDSNGTQFPMAISLTARQYFVDPRSISKKHDPGYIMRTVATALKLPMEEVQAAFSRTDSRYIKLGEPTCDDVAFAMLSTNKLLSGVGSTETIVRSYPQGRRMSHVLGFVNKEGVGSAGVELKYDSYLKGIEGLIESEKDANQSEIRDRRKIDVQPIAGSDVHLTLDHNIQYVVETALKEGVDKAQANGGWAIVQHIKSGAILAMASSPDFEPVNYNDETKDVWRNKNFSEIFEPGSVMKSFTIGAGLNEGLVTPNTMFDVGEGIFFWAGKPLRDHVTGRISVATGLKKSSNILCAKVGILLGPKRLETYFRSFGFGSPLGLDLPGEEGGLLVRGKDWDRDKLKIARVPIGQGVCVTAVQMVNAYSALANGGKVMKPYLIDRIVSANGQIILQNKPTVLARPIRPEVAKSVCDMLVGVTEEGGTGKKAVVKGYSVAGKTGTAQQVIPGVGYSGTDYWASFVGFVPASNPVFCVLVTIDRPDPKKPRTGGAVAAPVFSKIATATAQYLGIPPDMPDDVAAEEKRP